MAQQLQAINIVAPAFQGLNTQDSPLSLDANFATVADNAVIDRYGRIAARKGYTVQTTTKTELGSDSIDRIHVFRDTGGNTETFSTGNNKILSGTVTLVDETPGSYTVNGDDWNIVNFNDGCYFFRQGQEPLVYTNASGSLTDISSVGGYTGPSGRSLPDGQAVLAAYGRLWTANFADDKSTIYWSNLLVGHQWNTGSSGSIDISSVWPNGYDEIVALVAHNDYLIIFGKESIVVYEGAESPASMTLVDTITGVGLLSDTSYVYTGSDVLFMDVDGLRSFGRTIQEQSMPLTNLSQTVRTDLQTLIAGEGTGYKMVYSPENNFVIFTALAQNVSYVFDLRGRLENGAYRATRWTGMGATGYLRDIDGTLYIGSVNGIGTYSGYSDNGVAYRFKYFSPNLTFGDSSKLKLLKTVRPTIIGGSNTQVFFKWGYDFTNTFKTQTLTVPTSSAQSLYNVALFNVGKFSGGTASLLKRVNTTGNGYSVIVGLEADIDGSELSLQEMNVYTLIGRIV